jgi:hypothetical protein
MSFAQGDGQKALLVRRPIPEPQSPQSNVLLGSFVLTARDMMRKIRHAKRVVRDWRYVNIDCITSFNLFNLFEGQNAQKNFMT